MASRFLSSLACSTSAPSLCSTRVARHAPRLIARRPLLVKAAADSGGASNPSDEGPQAISLGRRLPGPEITFVLAGFLKIVTIGGLAYSAPVDAVRTAAGKMSPYLMVPVGLVMCWVAKVVVDNELQTSKRFMTAFVAFLVFMYFGLYRLLFRYDPDATVEPTRRGVPGSRVAQLRAQMGDRDLLSHEGHGPSASRDQRDYAGSQDGRRQSYYEAYGDQEGPGSTATLDARNPARRHQRRL